MRKDKWYLPTPEFLKTGLSFICCWNDARKDSHCWLSPRPAMSPNMFIYFNNSKRPVSIRCAATHGTTSPLSLTSRDFPPSGSGVYETERLPYSEEGETGRATGGISFFTNPPRLLLGSAHSPTSDDIWTSGCPTASSLRVNISMQPGFLWLENSVFSTLFTLSC